MSEQDTFKARRQTLALVLAGGRGSRLQQLTARQSKPSVSFGGKFRIIDFPLSNCVNSGIRRICVLTQYKAHSLIRHIQRGWSFLQPELNEFVELWPAQQQTSDEVWYQGTADAVYQNKETIKAHAPRYVLILAGDHVYKQDYSRMLSDHIASGADLTVSCIDVPREEATSFGVVEVDSENRILSFVEKPADPPMMPDAPDRALASMGIYIFNAAFLLNYLKEDAQNINSSHDFGQDIIPSLVGNADVRAHRFRDSCVYNPQMNLPYWRDVGTLDAYWEANLDLTAVTPELDIYDFDWPIWTFQEQRPAAKFVFETEERTGIAMDSLVSAGCIVSGAHVRRSLLFLDVYVHSYSLVQDSIILPRCMIGRNVRITRAILDEGCRVPDGLVIGEDPEADARRFHRTKNGVTLVTPSMLARLA